MSWRIITTISGHCSNTKTATISIKKMRPITQTGSTSKKKTSHQSSHKHRLKNHPSVYINRGVFYLQLYFLIPTTNSPLITIFHNLIYSSHSAKVHVKNCSKTLLISRAMNIFQSKFKLFSSSKSLGILWTDS